MSAGVVGDASPLRETWIAPATVAAERSHVTGEEGPEGPTGAFATARFRRLLDFGPLISDGDSVVALKGQVAGTPNGLRDLVAEDERCRDHGGLCHR